MKRLFVGLIALITMYTVQAQDILWGYFFNSDKIKNIDINPSTGITSGGWNNTISIAHTENMGYGNFGGAGWLIFTNHTWDDKIDLYARKADGSGTTILIRSDMPISWAQDKLNYLKLAVDPTGVGWIISRQWNTDTVRVLSFSWDGNITHTASTTNRGILKTSDNTNTNVNNGDIAIAGDGTLFVLVNKGGGDVTKVYTVKNSLLNSGNSSSINTLVYKWTLKNESGNEFNRATQGIAFSSTGSIYMSANTALYYLSQFTPGFSSTGTLSLTKVKVDEDLADLATSYYPMSAALPVKLANISVKLTYKTY